MQTHGEIPGTKEELKDKVMHLSLVAGGIPIFMSDSIFQTLERGNGIHLSLSFESDAEAHEAFDRLAQGGKVLDPLKTQFWGALFGLLEDKFGVLWQVTTEVQVNYVRRPFKFHLEGLFALFIRNSNDPRLPRPIGLCKIFLTWRDLVHE